MKFNKKLSWFLPITLIIGILVYCFLNLSAFTSFDRMLENYFRFKELTSKNIILSYAAYSILYILVVSFSLPVASSLTILGGMIFGWYAFFIIIFSATSGSIVVFIAAKTIANQFFKKKASSFLKNLEKDFKKNDVLYLISLRLIPLIPFWLVNVLPAFFGMKIKSYILGTFIGIIPGTFIYVWLSISINTILNANDKFDFSLYKDPSIIGSLTALGFLVLLHTYLKNMKSHD